MRRVEIHGLGLRVFLKRQGLEELGLALEASAAGSMGIRWVLVLVFDLRLRKQLVVVWELDSMGIRLVLWPRSNSGLKKPPG